jgi:hypothetical protein
VLLVWLVCGRCVADLKQHWDVAKYHFTTARQKLSVVEWGWWASDTGHQDRMVVRAVVEALRTGETHDACVHFTARSSPTCSPTCSPTHMRRHPPTPSFPCVLVFFHTGCQSGVGQHRPYSQGFARLAEGLHVGGHSWQLDDRLPDLSRRNSQRNGSLPTPTAVLDDVATSDHTLALKQRHV